MSTLAQKVDQLNECGQDKARFTATLHAMLEASITHGREFGLREAAEMDCVNHTPTCHCDVCEYRQRIESAIDKKP